MIKMVSICIFLTLLVVQAQAGPANRCSSRGVGIGPQKTVNINLTFSSYDSAVSLPGVSADEKSLNSIGKSITSNQVGINSTNFGSKKKILERMKNSVKGKSSVFFNYSGHGVLNAKGDESVIVLPSIPKGCLSESLTGSKGVAVVQCAIEQSSVTSCNNLSSSERQKLDRLNCAEHVLTSEDLRSVFGSRKVFGINDSCHAGGFDLGPKASMVNSSRLHETASDGGMLNGKPQGGLLVSEFEKHFNAAECYSDLNNDGSLDFYEAFAAIDPVSFPVSFSDHKGDQFLVREQNRTDRMRGLGEQPANSATGVFAQLGTEHNSHYNYAPNGTRQLNNLSNRNAWLRCAKLSTVKTNSSKCFLNSEFERNRTLKGNNVHLRHSTFPESTPLCKLKKSDHVRTTGRFSSNGWVEVEVVRSANSSCKGSVGWIGERFLNAETTTDIGLRRAVHERNGSAASAQDTAVE